MTASPSAQVRRMFRRYHRIVVLASGTAVGVIVWIAMARGPSPSQSAVLEVEATSPPVGITVEPPRTAVPAPRSIDLLQPMRDAIAAAGWADAGFAYRDERLNALAEAMRGRLADALSVWEGMPREGYRRQAVARAIILAITDDDRDVVLAWLDRAPWLAATLEPHGWVPQAAPLLRARLADRDRSLPEDATIWAAALASLGDPGDDAVLVETLGRIDDAAVQDGLARLLLRRPSCDWRAAVRSAWNLRPAHEGSERRLPLVPLALEAGEPAAVALIAASLARGRGTARHTALRSYVLAQPAFGGLIPDADWLAVHGARLVFRDQTWQLANEASVPAGQQAARASRAGSPRPPVVADAPMSAPPEGLAADADAVAVRAWIEAIAPTVAGRSSFRRDDPVVVRLAAIPSAHLGELLAASIRHQTNGAMRSYCECAVLRAVRQQHSELVQAAVERHPFLVQAVIDKGWQDLAAPTLRRMLRAPHLANRHADRVLLVHALCQVGDPADHLLLREVLLDMRFGYHQAAMAVALRELPGFDFDGAVRAAWGRRPRADYGDRQEAFCVVAAGCGVAEALPIAVAHATSGEVAWRSGSLAEEARRTLAGLLGTAAEADAIASWWEISRGRVRWDTVTRRWQMAELQPESASSRAADAGGF